MARPRKIQSPEEFERLIDDYVARCEAREEPVTLTGMIRGLGLSSRESLDHYATYDEDFYECVKRAKLEVEFEYEKRLQNPACTGAIFALKNLGWKDKSEVELGNQNGQAFKTENTWVVQPVKPLNEA